MARQKSLGLTGRQKLLGQLLVAVGCLASALPSTRYFKADYSWNVSIPFFKATAAPGNLYSTIWPVFYLVFIVVVLLGTSNAVNLTDGLDGLAISMTFIAMSALTAFTYFSSDASLGQVFGINSPPRSR